MAYSKNVIISENAAAFFTDFINRLTSVSNQVTLDQWVETSGVVTGADVKVFGRYVIGFSYSDDAYVKYTVKYGDNVLVSEKSLTVKPGSSYGAKITYRLAVNDKAVCLRLSNHNTLKKDVINFDMIFIISESNTDRFAHKLDNSTSLSVSVNALADYFYKADDSTQKYKIYNRLAYTADTNGEEFEIIESKILVSDTIKTAEITGLYDCSTVTADTLYMLDGKKYYAVDSNTLMEV